MSLIILFVLGFIVGTALGLVQLLIGETAYNILSALILLYLAYKFFSFFGFAWGIAIIVGFLIIFIMGLVDIGQDIWDFITGMFD